MWKSPDDGRDHSGKVDVQGGDRYHTAAFTLKIPVMGFEVRVLRCCQFYSRPNAHCVAPQNTRTFKLQEGNCTIPALPR